MIDEIIINQLFSDIFCNIHFSIDSDYIRTYTFDKRLESIVKTNLMGAKQGLPTIVPPKLYRQRFTEAMNRYFLAVPGILYNTIQYNKQSMQKKV